MLDQNDLEQIKTIVKETEVYLDQRITSVHKELDDRINTVITMIDEDLVPIYDNLDRLNRRVGL